MGNLIIFAGQSVLSSACLTKNSVICRTYTVKQKESNMLECPDSQYFIIYQYIKTWDS